MNGVKRTDHFKDLEVTFDQGCRFNYHVDIIVGKAFKMLGFLMRCSKWFRDIDSILSLYKSIVRSNLEYATTIWCPYYTSYIDKIETVQRRFTRFIFKKFHIPYTNYEDRLMILNLESLHVRRQKADLITLYKIMNGSLRTECVAEIYVRRRRNIRNMNVFEIPRATSNRLFYSPIYRMCRLYNVKFNNEYLFNLPLSTFKRILNSKF